MTLNARQPIDDHPAEQRAQHHRDKREGQHRAHDQRRPGLLQYPPGQDDLIQEIADTGDRLADPEQGERTIAERAKECH